jgi:hypothetical protein
LAIDLRALQTLEAELASVQKRLDSAEGSAGRWQASLEKQRAAMMADVQHKMHEIVCVAKLVCFD